MSPIVIEISGNTIYVFDKSCYAKQAKAMHEGAISQPSPIGLNQRPPMKKEVTPKYKGLKPKTSNEKEVTPKHKGLKPKTSDKKRANPKTQGA
jgi:hypothetical protein